MQVKSLRGVQQDDVWAAADALIEEGLRPTIERVRLKIGRGSPNTVSPMLEAWFATLGPRLGLGLDAQKTSADDFPLVVRQAMNQLWATAQLSAQQEAAQRLEQVEQALAADRSSLALKQIELTRQEEFLAERQAAADRALHVAQLQITDLAERLEQSQSVLVHRDSELNTLRSSLAAIELRRNAEQHKNDEEVKRHADERRRLDERAAGNERRLLEEIDLERQETKRITAMLAEVNRREEVTRRRFEADNKSLTDQLQKAEGLLKSQSQSLTSSNEMASEFRSLLDDQRAISAGLMQQLNLNMKNPVRTTLKASKPAIKWRRRV